MPEQSSLPDDNQIADWERSGTVILACAALASPPTPEVERIARERALAQFREAPPSLRTLRPEKNNAGSEGRNWVRRLLRRLAGK
jgi:hypothetical protein